MGQKIQCSFQGQMNADEKFLCEHRSRDLNRKHVLSGTYILVINHQKLIGLPAWGMAAMRDVPLNTGMKHGKTIRSSAWAGKLYCLKSYFV